MMAVSGLVCKNKSIDDLYWQILDTNTIQYNDIQIHELSMRSTTGGRHFFTAMGPVFDVVVASLI